MNYFLPSVDHARTCRAEMDALLLASMAEMSQASSSVAESEASRPPYFLDYAAYFDLSIGDSGGEALDEQARSFAADAVARRLSVPEHGDPAAAMPRITRFSTADYSTRQLDQMHRWWDIEPANRMAMTDPSDEEFDTVSAAVRTAMEHLALAAPEMHGEVEVLIRDIVLSKPDGTQRLNYSGASSFALWGALTINAETQREWLQAYRQIVHETAHNLLFAIARNGELVTVDAAERAQSPIRADPRPLDGVFHAAFVSARESLAYDRLLVRHEREGMLGAGDPEILEDLLELSVVAFYDALDTLRAQDGLLSAFGAGILDDCEAYMSEAFAIEPVD